MDKLFTAMGQDVTVPTDNINMEELEERSDLEMIETGGYFINIDKQNLI
jgi:hypothetical protein